MTRRRRAAYLALFVMSLIWGPALVFVKPAFALISPTQFLLLRFLAASVVAVPIFIRYLLVSHPKPRVLLRSLAVELVGIPIPLLLLYEGLARTSAVDASLIGSTGPIFVVLGGILFLHEHETKREWQGLGLSLLGSLLLVVEPLLRDGSSVFPLQTGNLYILGYDLVWTLYILLAKRVYKTHPPLALGGLTYPVTALIFAVKLYLSHSIISFSTLTSPAVLLAVLYMGILCTVIPFALNLFATARIEASEASLFTYLQGVLAIPFAALFLHEYPTPISWVAILLILWGVYRAEFQTHPLSPKNPKSSKNRRRYATNQNLN